MIKKLKENTKARGNILITLCDCTSDAAKTFLRFIKDENGKINNSLLKKYHELFAINEQLIKNIVPDVALQAMADNLVYSSALLPATSELHGSYIAIGTGSTTPAAGDTSLDVEYYREGTSSAVRNGKISQLTLFLGNSEANGSTISEVGTFAGDADVYGNSTSQFDITNPSGSTFRYTWDGTGTDPDFSTNGLVTGDTIVINGTNFNSNNNGEFTITDVADSYIEVTNASGVVESNKTLGTNTAMSRKGTLLNHALLSPTIAKDNTKTVTVQINFTFADA